MKESSTATALTCYHCGTACEETLWFDEKAFCCHGCRTVFEVLSANDLCQYYNLDTAPGIRQASRDDDGFAWLDDESIRAKVLTVALENFARVTFYIPAIHCVSCIWLLENLQKVNGGIVRSEVNFARKTVTVDFTSAVSVGGVASALASLGYAPKINLGDDAVAAPGAGDKGLVTKLAVAGFCFGNVMLFSFPEYLGLDHTDHALQRMFSFLNIALSVPVFLYSAVDYFRASVRSIRDRQINIDVPIAAGLLALFARSAYDILTGFGPGYLDSFTGLVFFLLIGRWFQGKTYQSLAFDRDFKSYFPLAVQRRTGGEWKPEIIYNLRRGDEIRVRNMEIVPADSVLLAADALIDYSFVTGESRPVAVRQGDLIFAGGRLVGQPVRLRVEKNTSQSHLTSLWNHDAFHKAGESRYKKVIDRAARRFTWVVLAIAAVTAVYWQLSDPRQMWLVLTSVLMVACPCALALAAPFTYGSMMRVFGRHQFYLKNADIIERLASIDTVVFDKTGTITHGDEPEVVFMGDLAGAELAAIRQLTGCSTHPLSVLVHRSIACDETVEVSGFREIPSRGIEGTVQRRRYRLGSPAFVGMAEGIAANASRVYVSVDEKVKGYFQINTGIRKGLSDMLNRLRGWTLAMLSGDNDADRSRMQELFPAGATLRFNQDPHEKLEYVRQLQHAGGKVLMLGDGLNDSGAIRQSDAGIAVTDDTGIFTPACDGILHGSRIGSLDKYLALARASAFILKAGFLISFFYNAIALGFAVSGHLTPLVAAILMPVSSISVVGFTTMAVNLAAKQKRI